MKKCKYELDVMHFNISITAHNMYSVIYETMMCLCKFVIYPIVLNVQYQTHECVYKLTLLPLSILYKTSIL